MTLHYGALLGTSLLQAEGTLGLIATNSVAQGESREVGLDAMIGQGFTITRAIQSQSWPSASANLEFAAVWGTLGSVGDEAPRIANGEIVHRISTLLEAAGRVEGLPQQLQENKGIAFEGCKLRGTGFIIDPGEASEWQLSDPANKQVLFPYLNGEDLNSRPDSSASRWVIDFTGHDGTSAARFRLPFDRVDEVVSYERKNLGAQLREKFWLYERPRAAMRKAIAGLSEVLVIACTSKSVMPVRVSTGQVFSNALDVFATMNYGDQAVLSSSLHQLWAITYGSTLETRIRYTPSDVFETFPRPVATARLAEIGRALDEERREIMVSRDLGLTNIYNLVNSPDVSGDADIDRLRQVHVEVDEAVMAAFGWTDLNFQHGFHSYRQERRWGLFEVERAPQQ
ncbi:type IIL restriction-modification enzyme MmeI [Gordonia alkaliphila]|uniref:MmeI-like target recognition domain-containing protein n=1 Tax=Gordonia alkaliphila TaxID=1053547 RepID=A0ABP8ZKR0_9ACTN